MASFGPGKPVAYHEEEKRRPSDPLQPTTSVEAGHVQQDDEILSSLGYKAELSRNRSLWTVLFQALAIAAVPYGEGSSLITALYGGGQLPFFVGYVVVVLLDECVALSLAEIASRYPTASGPAYSVSRLAKSHNVFITYVTGWIWLIGNLTITLSVNFGMASILAATVSISHPEFVANAWQLLLIFYAILMVALVICVFGNRFLPLIDTICAGWTAVSIIIILIALSSVAATGRHSAAYSLGNYETDLSGWGRGFSFFIGLLPAAYTFAALGMVTAMSEEVHNPVIQMPRALALSVPIAGVAGLFFVIPICVILPSLSDIITNAPLGQALPYVFHEAMGTAAGGIGLTFLVLGVAFFCSVSITTAAGRTTWAFARDNAIPLSSLWSKVDTKLETPVWALVLLTVVQALLGLISLGSTSAFNAFISAGVIGLALSYAIPISISLFNGRKEISTAKWNLGNFWGTLVNVVSVLWIAFELVLFSMPTVLTGLTAVSMNYASVVVAGFMVLSIIWYFVYARKVYSGPPASDGIPQGQE